MAKLLIFNEEVEKILGFLIVYKFFTFSREADIMGLIICIGRISRYLEEECYRRFKK